jgi:hypothetical protein
MYFVVVLLIGLATTFLSIKLKISWAKWIPALIFLIATVFIGLKILFFPAPEMAILGEIIYFMIFGCLTLGAAIGGTTIYFLKKRKVN